jgi:hypothetical protein
MPTQTNWPPKDGDITYMIERLDALEEREGVRFEALSARILPGKINGVPLLQVCGEMHARDGLEITHEIKVVITVYDPEGKILEIYPSWFKPEKFYGFAAFSNLFVSIANRIGKIRVYPQRA